MVEQQHHIAGSLAGNKRVSCEDAQSAAHVTAVQSSSSYPFYLIFLFALQDTSTTCKEKKES